MSDGNQDEDTSRSVLSSGNNESKIVSQEDIPETPESRIRRAVIGIVFAVAASGWFKIQFDAELNGVESSLKKVSPSGAKLFSNLIWGDRISSSFEDQKRRLSRKPMTRVFTRSLGACILSAAVSDLRLTDEDTVRRDEKAIATKAATLFPGAKLPAGNGEWDFDRLCDAEELANVALYSRLRALSKNLPSPLSRKNFREAVAKRVLESGLLGSNYGLEGWTVKDARTQSDVWLGGVRAILDGYEDAGFAMCSIGDGGQGLLDVDDWVQTGKGAITVLCDKLAVINACQALAGESLNDLSAALLPTTVLVTYLTRCGMVCDAEDYYISDTYTRDPAEYRPNGLVIQFNIAIEPLS